MTRALRLPTLVLLPVLAVLALVAEAGRSDAPSSQARLSEMTPTAAAPGTPSSTWYCAAGSATGAASGLAEQRVIVSNTSDTTARGTITVVGEDGTTAAVPLSLGAHSRTTVLLSDHVKSRWAAALVEVSDAQVAVAQDLVGPAGRSASACASAASANWYFPSGTTRAGSGMWMALYNPFPGEATVDLSFDTDDGARSPQDFQGLVVPGGRVVVVDVAAAVTLREHVATTVSTRNGRIIAEQLQTTDGRDGTPKGLTATVGATTPAPTWTFPAGAADNGAETVSLFNPGEADTEVSVQVQLADPATNGSVEPFEVRVPAHRFAVVDVAADGRVPRGVAHWLVVRSADGSKIVAERAQGGDGGKGLTYTVGLPVVATEWVTPLSGGTSSALAIVNPSATSTATVSVRRQARGQVQDLPGAGSVVIPPGEWALIERLPAEVSGGDTSFLVASDQPVAVGQWFVVSRPDDVSSPVGVPVMGTQSLPVDVIGPQVASATPDAPASRTDTPADSASVPAGDTATTGG